MGEFRFAERVNCDPNPVTNFVGVAAFLKTLHKGIFSFPFLSLL